MIKVAFPLAQILMCLGAAVVYAAKQDWPRTCYWTMAAGLTGTTLFMKG